MVLPVALDRTIPENALVANEIMMPFENVKSKGDAVIYYFSAHGCGDVKWYFTFNEV